MKKLDKSLLPQPQKPVGWKRGVLQIATDSKTDLSLGPGQLPPTTKNSAKNTMGISSEVQQQKHALGDNTQMRNERNEMRNEYQTQGQSRQSIKPRMGMTDSQYSLEQKQLLTFAANQSNEDEEERNIRNRNDSRASQANVEPTEQKRSNRFSSSHQSLNNEQSRNQSDSAQSSQHTNVNRSSSKNKQHKASMYKQNLQQSEEFIAYSVVTKESKSGMFSNEKLLMLNSFKRQLVYFSKLPKLLPFGSYSEMERQYLVEERPKEVIELDKVRRFMFVPAKGSLATVAVSYVNEKGERKEWKLGMGNNSLMGEWIELVNEVFKKQHYSMIKSQVKYPPKPKKQAQNKSNNYETKFTKTLKQQVLPAIKQFSIRGLRGNDTPLNQSQLSGSKSSKNPREGPKQYAMDKSKFVNTKSYIIDMEDVSNEDIVYEPEVRKEEVRKEESGAMGQDANRSKESNPQSQKSLESQDWQGMQEDSNVNSRFSQHLSERQRQITSEHNHRISSYMKESNENQQRQFAVADMQTQPVVLSRKLSGERLSQTTHQDLNVHIQSRAFEEEKERRGGEMSRVERMNDMTSSQLYEPVSRVTADHVGSRVETANNVGSRTKDPQYNAQSITKSIIQPKPLPFSPPAEQPRKRIYTQTVEHPAQSNRQKITFTNDSMRSSTSSQQQPFTKPTQKPKYRLQQPPSNSTRKRMSSSFVTQNSQIEDIILGGKLHDGYILNFSPYSYGNNWFRLWLETEPNNRVDVYASFVRACNALVHKIIDTPHNFAHSSSLEKNNTHLTYTLENITFKLPFKLPLPQGLGEFISVMDFTRSEEFLSQVFKYQTELTDEYHNYQYVLDQLASEFNAGVLSMPIYFPMCCLIKYKGMSVLCKASWETARLNCYKVVREEVAKYEKEVEYVEEACRVKFGREQGGEGFDLYEVYLPVFGKSIIYMDNLKHFLPLLPNPLHKNSTPNMQLTSSYIQQHIRRGMISSNKDIEQIQKHLISSVVKMYAEEVVEMGRKIVTSSELSQLLYGKGGLREEHLGMVYRRVEEREHKVNARSQHASSLVLTEIILAEYVKACQLYFMKEHFKHLYTSISQQTTKPTSVTRLSTSQASNNSKTIKNLPSYTSATSTFGQSYASTILQILHYMIYRNSKVWSVISVALEEKYGIGEFRKLGQRQGVEALMGRVCMGYLVVGLLGKLGVEAEVKSWAVGMTWGTLPLNEDNLKIVPYAQAKCFHLGLFNFQYASLINQLALISSSSSFSSILTSKSLFPAILQILGISEESHENQSFLIKSASYELLECAFANERQLIDFALSYFIPPFLPKNQSTKAINTKTRQKHIELYTKLLDQTLTHTSTDISINQFDLQFNGIKWLIKQKEYELVEVLIQEQLQAISIWYHESLLETKCRLLELAGVFYSKKLGNRNNMAVEYAMSSLKLAMQHKSTLPLSVCAQKCFQAANIHFDSGLIQKSLELYELAQEYIIQSERNKSLQQTDLSLEFLKLYLRKAEIKLAMGKKNQTLHECLECLRKCEEFEDILGLERGLTEVEYASVEREKEQLAELEIGLFEIIFRTYEVAKNPADMQSIAQLCCNKFVEDKVLILRMTQLSISKNIEDSVSPSLMSKLLKMCWLSILHKIVPTTKNASQQQNLSKTLTVQSSSITRKSFCLSGALSQQKKNPQSNHYQKLQQLKQKLSALSKLYPKNRYDNETLAMIVCREIVEASARMNLGKSVMRGEYQLIGNRRKNMSGRVEEMISANREGDGDANSVLYKRLWEVVRDMTDQEGAKSQKRIQRYQTESAPYQHPSTRQNSYRYEPITQQPPSQTSTKRPRFYQPLDISTSEFTPFTPQNTYEQPQLRMSFILDRAQTPKNNINNYDIYSLKDQMDRKYMLVEALFGLCGREFVMGCVEDRMEEEGRRVNGGEWGVFYQ